MIVHLPEIRQHFLKNILVIEMKKILLAVLVLAPIGTHPEERKATVINCDGGYKAIMKGYNTDTHGYLAVFKDGNELVVDNNAEIDSTVGVDAQFTMNVTANTGKGSAYTLVIENSTQGATDHYSGDFTRKAQIMVSYSDMATEVSEGKIITCPVAVMIKGYKY